MLCWNLRFPFNISLLLRPSGNHVENLDQKIHYINEGFPWYAHVQQRPQYARSYQFLLMRMCRCCGGNAWSHLVSGNSQLGQIAHVCESMVNILYRRACALRYASDLCVCRELACSSLGRPLVLTNFSYILSIVRGRQGWLVLLVADSTCLATAFANGLTEEVITLLDTVIGEHN